MYEVIDVIDAVRNLLKLLPQEPAVLHTMHGVDMVNLDVFLVRHHLAAERTKVDAFSKEPFVAFKIVGTVIVVAPEFHRDGERLDTVDERAN